MILPRNVLLFFIKRSTEVHAWLGKVRFLLGGWAGASEGRVIRKIFRKWGGPDLLELKSGGGSQILYNNKKFTTCDFYKIDSLLNYKNTNSLEN